MDDAKRRVDQLTQIRLVEFRHDAAHLGMLAERFDPRDDLFDETLADAGRSALRVPVPERLEIRDRGFGESNGGLGRSATSVRAASWRP